MRTITYASFLTISLACLINASAFTLNTGHPLTKIKSSSIRARHSGCYLNNSAKRRSKNINVISDLSLIQPNLREERSSLYMGYNLPPSNENGGDLKSLIPGIATLAATILFFLSPLGGIFFAITNTFFTIALLAPILATLGFQIWQYFYTIEGPCPNCGAPARVLKEDNGDPNLCLSCGSLIRATVDCDGIELCNDPNEIFNEGGFASIFDSLFGNESITIVEDEVFSTNSLNRETDRRSRGGKSFREGKIIDVDVERD
mmetsp:Transcript_13776/g.19704  ORF Transcript_13776/g.19704 Transcript_13776/m.19704 type:complete len:260 (+) Transcript_13776:56-835(+)